MDNEKTQCNNTAHNYNASITFALIFFFIKIPVSEFANEEI